MKISSVCFVCLIATFAGAMAQQPTPTAATAATSTPSTQPAASEEPKLVPAPSAPPGSESSQPTTRGKFRSQAKKFNPKKVVPMASPTPTPQPTPKSSPK